MRLLDWSKSNGSLCVYLVCLIMLTGTNCSRLNPRWRPISLTENIRWLSEQNSSQSPFRLFAVLPFLLFFFNCKQPFHLDKDELSQMSRESCCSTRLAFSLSVLRSLLMGAQITHPQLELGNQQESFESTSLSCVFFLLLSNCELDYDSLFCLPATACICNLSLVKVFCS